MNKAAKEIIPVEDPGDVTMLEHMARDPSVDPGKFERFLAMQERMEDRAAAKQFNLDMNLCQKEMLPISQDAANPQTKSKYASYEALDSALRPIYVTHGLNVSFNTSPDGPEGHVRVLGEVSHNDGHVKQYQLDMPNDGKGAKGGDVMTKTHAQMSAVSYARRGLLKMMFNIAEGDADDDGNQAGGYRKVDEAQLEMLTDLAAEVGADEAKFCDAHGVATFADIGANKFKGAMDRLREYGASK